MQDLCESLYREINGLSAGASKAYSDLETSMDRLFSQRRLNFEAIKYNRRLNGKKKSIFIYSGTPEVQKRVGKNAERISRARSGLEEISFDGTLESCAHAMDAMNSVYHALGETLPAPDEADVLVDEILERYDKTRYGENVAFLKRISPITGLLGSAITSMHMDTGAISEAIVSAAASLSAFSSRFVHRPYFGLAFTHWGLGAATLTALLSGHVSSHSFTDVPEANYIINGVALGTLGFINTALGVIAGAAANSERKFRKIAGEIKISKLKYDGLLRVGVALEEGKRNLGYVMRVCESEKRDPQDFEDQLNTLREAMGNYLGGRGSYSDLVSARVSYFPVLIEDFERLTTKLGKSLFGEGFNTLYQFLSSVRQPDGTPLMDSKKRITSHLSGLFYRNINLLSDGIKLVYVFDGKPPELKWKTHKLRGQGRDAAKEKYEEAKQDEDIEAMKRYSIQLTRLDEEMIQESKELLEAMGIAVVQAPSEGEAESAYLARVKQEVFASASQDYDSLLFGAPRLIQNLTLARRRKTFSGWVEVKPEIIELEKVLNLLEINLDQLICLGILVGTDYNPKGIPGIGQKKALDIVRKYKQPVLIFESVGEKLVSLPEEDRFDWKDIFELFKKHEVVDFDIKFPKVDQEKIKEILVEKHDFSGERVEKQLEKLRELYEAKKQKNLGKWF